jgi:hypothetical protein
MGLPWVRLDSAFARNHKIIDLAHGKRWQAIVTYVAGLGYSGEHGLAGFIPEPSLPFIHGTKTIASQLCEAGLWISVPGGWEVNDWAEYQPTNEEAERRRTRAQTAARARWEKARAKDPVTNIADRRRGMA